MKIVLNPGCLSLLILLAIYTKQGTCTFQEASDEAGVHEFPWMVHLAVDFGDNLYNFCGASLIDNSWLLTSSSCMRYKSEQLPIEKITALFGRHDLGLRAERSQVEQIIPASSVYIHPKFASQYSYDFALIKLNTPLMPTSTFSLIDLPDTNCNPSYGSRDTEVDFCHLATTVGWGIKKARQPYSDYEQKILHKTIIPIVSYVRHCSWAGPFTNASICAGGRGAREDACLGDIGAPLMCVSKNYHQWYIIGVTSLASCGENVERRFEGRQLSGVYARVCEAIPWIRQYIPTTDPELDFEREDMKTTRRIETTTEEEEQEEEEEFIKPDLSTDRFCKTGIPRVAHARVFIPAVVGLPVVDGKPWFPSGFRLSVHCGHGYSLISRSSSVICLPSGQWDVRATCA